MTKKLYLTIDDFPSKASEEMLYFLKEKEISCVLFCIGRGLEKQKELASMALSMGYELGNHSYSHKHFSKLSLKSAYLEIERCHLILEEVYARAGVSWNRKYFRFPYGDKGDGTGGQVFRRGDDSLKRLKKRRIQKKLAELGYSNIITPGVSYHYYKNYLEMERDAHWTFDVMEWVMKRNEGMFGLTSGQDVLNRLFQENPFDCRGVVPEENYGLMFPYSSEVILMHDCEQTFPIFKKVISRMMERGYTFGKLADTNL